MEVVEGESIEEHDGGTVQVGRELMSDGIHKFGGGATRR